MKNSLLTSALGLSVAILAAACGGTPDATESEATAETSAEGKVSTTNQAFSVDDVISLSKKAGLRRVDPNSLNPPAVVDEPPYIQPTPFDICFKTNIGTTCVLYPHTWRIGDGTKEGQNGIPFDTGIACDQGFEVYADFQQTWAIVRLYNQHGDMYERWIAENQAGKFYNSRTGKSGKYFVEDLWHQTYSRPGDLSSETLVLSGNDFGAAKNTGQILAVSYGSLTFNEDGSFVEVGKHPLFDYFNGDYASVAPVCNYVK